MDVRKPSAAGQFYPADEKRLEQSIKECFMDERGPKRLPEIQEGDKNVRGVVVPHAGLPFSGAIAAHSFLFLAENGFADSFIVLGPNHTGMGSGVAVMTKGGWEMPFGRIPINQDFGEQLAQGKIIDEDEKAHSREHSIEVQLPFLQHIKKQDWDFVPICMAMHDMKTCEEIGRFIAEIIEESDRKTAIVASSDFSHIGMNYMSMPPAGMRVDEYAEKQDKKAIEPILNLDSEGLVETVEEENISMCGYGPVAAMMVASIKLGAENAELFKYGSSYEVHPGQSCVGYGSIGIY
ncbi:MAG: AmmeMemoRadiSam system protein B [Candidatus Thermoplasmatota archaeon]